MALRLLQLKIFLTGCAVALLFVATGHGLAQIRQIAPADGDDRRTERRFERQLDDLQKAHDALQLNLETRLVKIETYMNAGTWLLGAIVTVLVAQLLGVLGKGVTKLLAQRQEHIGKSGGP